MPRQRVREQHVLDLGAGADVVDHQMAVGAADGDVGDDADVGDAGGEAPGDDVAGAVVGAAPGDGERGSFAAEEGGQVGDAAVIDVRVRAAKTPVFRIEAEGRLHVLVHQHLQVDAGVAIGANDDV